MKRGIAGLIGAIVAASLLLAGEGGATAGGGNGWVATGADATGNGKSVARSQRSGEWYVVSRTADECGKSDVLRRGRYVGGRGWGFRKIAGKHNIKRPLVWRHTIAATCGKREAPGSTTWIYLAVAVKYRCGSDGCAVTGWQRLRAVEQRKVINGVRRGNITMYCIGRVRCPNWLNTEPYGKRSAQIDEFMTIEPISN